MSLSNIGTHYFGTVTANNGTVVNIAYSGITANSVVLLTVKTATGANAGGAIVTRTTLIAAGGVPAGFSIASGAADTSVYNFIVLNVQ